MITCTLNAAYILGLSKLAPKNDIRYYLNGVYVHHDGHGVLSYVVTNGSALIALRETLPECDGIPPEFELIIPRDIAAKAVPESKKLTRLFLTQREGDTWQLSPVKGGDRLFQAIDGRFLDWRRVIPAGDVSGKVAQFDPNLMATTVDALLSAVGGKFAPFLEHNDTGPARMVHECGIAVIMPMRNDEPMKIPADMRDWLRGWGNTAEAKAA